MGSEYKTLLFKFKKTKKITQERQVETAVYTYPDGRSAVEEQVFFDKNHRLHRYTTEQLQTQEKGFLEIRDQKIFFSYTKNGKTKTNSEELETPFVVGPTMVPYLKKHWAQLMAGDTIKVRFGVLDRRETVGFKYFKYENLRFQQKPAVVIKMKPSSFFIAALVDPLYLTFSPDGQKLLAIKGRTRPKIKKNGKWKDLDAETLYLY